jgi:hypothetical protein
VHKTTLQKKSSFYIIFNVISSIFNVDGAVSTPTCTLLKQLENDLDRVENIGDVLEDAKDTRDDLIVKTDAANTSNENLVNSTSTADTTKNALDALNTNANTTKLALDTANTTAVTNKNNLDVANVQAVKNYEALEQLGDATDLAKKVESQGSQLNDMENNKADDTDSNRTTTSKTVTGAINELNSNKATKDELNALGQLKLEDEYGTLTELQTTFPTGTTGLYLVIEDGYVYRWSGSEWIQSAQFQSTGIADNSITTYNLKDDILTQKNNDTIISLDKISGNVKYDGIIASSTTVKYVELDVQEGERYKVSGRVYTGTIIVLVVFLDESGSVVSYLNPTNSTESVRIEDYEVKVPSGVTKMYVNSYNDSLTPIVKSTSKEIKVSYKDVDEDIKVLLNNNSKKSVILDTDFNSDIDDVFAIRTLSYLKREGLIDILGICLSTNIKQTVEDIDYESIPALDALLKYDGVYDIQLGIDFNATGATPSYYKCLNDYYHTIMSNSECMDNVTFYRKVLSEISEGKKCDIVCVGFLTNIYALLNSESDSYSDLTGIELMNEKVNNIYIMGGRYDYQESTNRDTNLGQDTEKISASNYVFENSPIKLIFLGIEFNTVQNGQKLIDNNMIYDPVYKSLKEYWTNRLGTETIKPRSSWDPLTVLLGVLGNDKTGLSLIQGENHVNTSLDTDYLLGTNTFTENSTGNHFYVKRRYSDEYYRDLLEDIICKKNWNVK